MWHRLRKLTIQAAIAVAIALFIMFFPLPQYLPSWTHQVQVAIGAAVLVCTLGKLLYDTLFYDHYRP